ncbi:MAG: hypothetical protein R3E04_13265 [Sphingobium sp.]
MVRTLIASGERSARILTLAKLASVSLSMLWGFAVTYSFIRVLPQQEFSAFLLLIAFNNFTISAEFGITTVIYARLRRFWLGQRDDGTEAGTFRREEIGVLFLFLIMLIVIGAVVVIAAMAAGWIRTELPAVFLLFFFASGLNLLLLLAKRALAAVDLNLVWELSDIGRRILGLGVLAAILAGVELVPAMVLLVLINLAGGALGMALIHRRAGLKGAHWLSWRIGGGHVRRTYLRDIGASAALTISEVAAYNSPYFVIAALSHDPRMLLLFDFLFKMIRAVATAIRATIEGALPRLTAYWFADDHAAFRRALLRALAVALGIALCADLLLIAFGQRIFAFLYDQRTDLLMPELLLLCLLLLALAIMCTSVYLQGALGRFGPLLRQSLPFLAGSLASVPLAIWIGGSPRTDDIPFMIIYALCFIGAAVLHIAAMRRLVRQPA